MSSEVPYSDLDTGKWTAKALKKFIKDNRLFKGYSKMKKADLVSMIAKARSGSLPASVMYKTKRAAKKRERKPPLLDASGNIVPRTRGRKKKTAAEAFGPMTQV